MEQNSEEEENYEDVDQDENVTGIKKYF